MLEQLKHFQHVFFRAVAEVVFIFMHHVEEFDEVDRQVADALQVFDDLQVQVEILHIPIVQVFLGNAHQVIGDLGVDGIDQILGLIDEFLLIGTAARIHEVAGFVDRGIDDCAHFPNGLFGNGQRGRRHLMRDPGVHVVEVDFNPLRFVARNQLLDEIAHDVQQRQINDDADDLK